ncbi:MAG TPA: LytTR family DNA-binding domain-containing protein [Cyclobacteriaceae bacterium]|nr:LytTR family DNA-binding domain-containing protein [Cyclobacteriaceae bacterium]
MNITCLIIDDEPLARNLIREYVGKVSYLDLKGMCSNALEAIDFLRQQPVDLLFLDIQMPDLTGISFLKALQKKPMVIFTTAYSEYALESYDLDVVDYLLKPITFERFLRAVEKASQRSISGQSVTLPEKTISIESTPFIFVKDGTKLVKVKWEDILYIEGLKDYVTIHTRDQKIVTLQRLKVLETQLPADKFIRIHNSYIVALNAIEVIYKNEVQVAKAMLPISESYKKPFREFVEKNHLR